MENAIEFDLNLAVSLWRAQLSRSPQFRAENRDELEAHLRDSIAVLQAKGLSPEESFIIAARRIGGVSALEREFAGENGGRGWRNALRRLTYRYLDKVIHTVVLLYFAVGYFFLWGMLQLGWKVSLALSRTQDGTPLPQFTQWVFGLRHYGYAPLFSAFIYCVIVWIRKPGGRSDWLSTFAVTTAMLLLLAFAVLIGVGLPLIDFLNFTLRK